MAAFACAAALMGQRQVVINKVVRFLLAAAQQERIKLSTASCVVTAVGIAPAAFQTFSGKPVPYVFVNLLKNEAHKSLAPL